MQTYEQPHLQNSITHTCHPIIRHRKHSSDTILTINPWLQTPLEEGPKIHVVEAATEEGLSEDSTTFADLSYQDFNNHFAALRPPGLNDEPAHPDTSSGVPPADEPMSIMLQGTTSTLLSLALSKSSTLCSGMNKQEVYLLQWHEHQGCRELG